ncbi:MAG: hypothetical protein ABJL54_01705 [Halioglobus sp.]
MKLNVNLGKTFLASQFTLGLFLASLPALGQYSPNNSIAPEIPKPTPYGGQITRSEEVLPAPFTVREVEENFPPALLQQINKQLLKPQGPYDPNLSQPLHQMGKYYQSQERHPEAMPLLLRSLHVAKINEGLYTPNQLPLLSDIIHSQLSMERYDDADQFFKALYRLQNKTYDPGSLEMYDATRRYVAWQRQAYLQGVGDKPSYERLLNMHVIHSEEITRIRQGEWKPKEIIPHLYDRMLVEYLISEYGGERQASIQINVTGSADPDPVMEGGLEGERFRQLQRFNERNGRKTLKQIIWMEKSRSPIDHEALATAYVALGDWSLWWHRVGRALESYEKAWAVLEEDNANNIDPESWFQHPVELPDTSVFLSDGSKPHEDLEARAKVSFSVTKTGEVRDIDVREQAPEGDIGARVVLFRLLRELRFRPVLREGKAVPYAGLEREYNYQY